MKSITRNGIIYNEDNSQEKLLKKLYGTITGRKILKLLTAPTISKIGGALLNTKVSTLAIDNFVKSNNIKMSDYIPKKYTSYNDFFTRKIKPEKRPIDYNTNSLITPSDGKITIYRISDNLTMKIKDTIYTVESILQDEYLAEEYNDGYCVVIRLTVDNYHRYCNIDNGKIIFNKFIPGILHTVNPIANDYYEIYKENSRELTVLETENFGKIIQMEVGALMVGKISNNQKTGNVAKGSEKGYFEFGGSTIVLFLKNDCVEIDSDLIDNSKNGYETIVYMGEKIGRKK